MKQFLVMFFTVFLSSGVMYASGEIYDSFKGSFGMYSVSAEMVVLNNIESQTDSKTEKMAIGGLTLKFEYIESELAQENGLQVAYVHFTDNEDKYILTYHVDGNNIVKIMLFSKNSEFKNIELYPAKNTEKKENCPEEKKQGK